MHVRWGKAETWIAAAVTVLLTGAMGVIYKRIDTQLDRQNDSLGVLATQQAVMASQLSTMNVQLANVPGLTERVSRLEVRTEALEEGQREQRQLRGVR